MADPQQPSEWRSVAVGFFLAIVGAIVGLVIGIVAGASMSGAFGPSLPVLMMLFGPVAVLVLVGRLVRKDRGLLKGVWIGGSLMVILASLCVGIILSL
jgi:hypothetical protein